MINKERNKYIIKSEPVQNQIAIQSFPLRYCICLLFAMRRELLVIYAATVQTRNGFKLKVISFMYDMQTL